MCDYEDVEYQILDDYEVDEELIKISENLEEQYKEDLEYYAENLKFNANNYIVNPEVISVDESYIGSYVYTSNNQHIYIN